MYIPKNYILLKMNQIINQLFYLLMFHLFIQQPGYIAIKA